MGHRKWLCQHQFPLTVDDIYQTMEENCFQFSANTSYSSTASPVTTSGQDETARTVTTTDVVTSPLLSSHRNQSYTREEEDMAREVYLPSDSGTSECDDSDSSGDGSSDRTCTSKFRSSEQFCSRLMLEQLRKSAAASSSSSRSRTTATADNGAATTCSSPSSPPFKISTMDAFSEKCYGPNPVNLSINHGNSNNVADKASSEDEQPLDLSTKSTAGSCTAMMTDATPEPSAAERRSPTLSPPLGYTAGSTSMSILNPNRHLIKSKPYAPTATKRTYTQRQLQDALFAVQSGKMGTRSAAVFYKVPRSTVRNQLNKLNMKKKQRCLQDDQQPRTEIPSTDIGMDNSEERREDEDEEDEEEEENIEKENLPLAAADDEPERKRFSPAAVAPDGVASLLMNFYSKHHQQQMLQAVAAATEKQSTAVAGAAESHASSGSPPPPTPSSRFSPPGLRFPTHHGAPLLFAPGSTELLSNTGAVMLPSVFSQLVSVMLSQTNSNNNNSSNGNSSSISSSNNNNNNNNNNHHNNNSNSNSNNNNNNNIGSNNNNSIFVKPSSSPVIESNSSSPFLVAPDFALIMQQMMEEHRKHELQQRSLDKSRQSSPVDSNVAPPLFKSSRNGQDRRSPTVEQKPSLSLNSSLNFFPGNSAALEDSKSDTRSPSIGSGNSDSPPSPPLKNLNLRDVIAKSITQRFQQPTVDGYSSGIANAATSPTAGVSLEHPYRRFVDCGSTIQNRHGPINSLVVDDRNSQMNATSTMTNKVPPSQHSSNVGAGQQSVAVAVASSGKGTRPKRGKYRNYDRDSLVEAVRAVQRGEMSVHRAGSFYGVPHSTLEYKVKERHLLRPRKREPKSQSSDELLTSKKREDGSIFRLASSTSASIAPSTFSAAVHKCSSAALAGSENKRLFSPLPPLSATAGTANDVKLSQFPFFDPAFAAAGSPFPIPMPFYQLAAIYSNSANSNAVANLLTTHPMHKMPPQQPESTSKADSSALPSKNVVELAESLYDGSAVNGSFLDGIIRSSLETGFVIPVSASATTLVNNNNDSEGSPPPAVDDSKHFLDHLYDKASRYRAFGSRFGASGMAGSAGRPDYNKISDSPPPSVSPENDCQDRV